MRTELTKVSQNFAASVYDIVLLSETWLTSLYTNTAFKFDNFTVFRRDCYPHIQTDSREGGVLIAIRNRLPSRPIENPDDSIEQVWILLPLPHTLSILCCVYIPPDSDYEIYVKFNSSINLIHSVYPDANILIFGNFNLPNFFWSNTQLGVNVNFINKTLASNKTSASYFANYINLNNLHQHKKSFNNNKVLLDLVFLKLNFLQTEIAIDILSTVDIHHPYV